MMYFAGIVTRATVLQYIIRKIANSATLGVRAYIQFEIWLAAVRMCDPGTPTGRKIEDVFPSHIGNRNLGLDTGMLQFIGIELGVVFLLAAGKPVTLLPLTHLTAIFVVARRSLEIGIEPEPEWPIFHFERSRQDAHAILTSTGVYTNIPVLFAGFAGDVFRPFSEAREGRESEHDEQEGKTEP
jgi:hypothetical protein